MCGGKKMILFWFLAGLGVIFSIALYVLYGFSHMKALKMMGYQNAWAAWIPFYKSYALADCIPETKGEVKMASLSIPGDLFKFWWILSFLVGFIPGIGTLASIAINIFCGGFCYTSIYSILERKPKNEVETIGYLSGWLNIIASFKFLAYEQ